MSYPVETLESWKLAYIAGIVDGEGCIAIRKHSKSRQLAPVLTVDMTNFSCVKLLHYYTGVGTFRIVKRVERQKASYIWAVQGRLELYILIKAIHPYLVVKKLQADVMLEFVERRIQDISISGRDFELRTKMHELNKGIEEVKDR